MATISASRHPQLRTEDFVGVDFRDRVLLISFTCIVSIQCSHASWKVLVFFL